MNYRFKKFIFHSRYPSILWKFFLRVKSEYKEQIQEKPPVNDSPKHFSFIISGNRIYMLGALNLTIS
ncbi:MAG: hypothetical protein EA393_05760 [Bacteroidetes bacterium]|nr:MAG: hypothetical protein EA393_05760 [Bacteroidota bacterium]